MVRISTGQHINQKRIDIDVIKAILERIKLSSDFRIFVDTMEYFNGVREEREKDFEVLIINIDRAQFDRAEHKYHFFLTHLLRGLRWTSFVDGDSIADEIISNIQMSVKETGDLGWITGTRMCLEQHIYTMDIQRFNKRYEHHKVKHPLYDEVGVIFVSFDTPEGDYCYIEDRVLYMILHVEPSTEAMIRAFERNYFQPMPA